MSKVELSYSQAIERALDLAMQRDPTVIIFGEDTRLLRRNLFARHGSERVLDAPISESAFLGAGVGAAMAGLRPIVEIMLVDFLGVALGGLLNHAAKIADFCSGAWQVPLVVRAACGGGYGDGGQHSQVLWGLLAGIPGLSVVAPSTPADAAGLMLAAIGHDGPVVFLEHKLLSDDWLDYLGGASRDGVDFDVPAAGALGIVAEPLQPTPLGRAALRRQGIDVTLISVGVGAHRCLQAADHLAADGIQAGVLDLRSLAPLDRDAIVELAAGSGRVVVADEDYLRGGLSGEVAATLAESGLACRLARVAVETTIPFDPVREAHALPSAQRIQRAAAQLMG